MNKFPGVQFVVAFVLIVTLLLWLHDVRSKASNQRSFVTSSIQIKPGQSWTYEWAYSEAGPWSRSWSTNVETDLRPKLIRTVILN